MLFKVGSSVLRNQEVGAEKEPKRFVGLDLLSLGALPLLAASDRRRYRSACNQSSNTVGTCNCRHHEAGTLHW
jgi:hypothetical protein